MKTIKISLVLLLSMMLSIQLYASKDNYTQKTTFQSVNMNKDASIFVKNKYGKVHFMNWEQNAISIEATITVKASSEENAQKFFDKIDISISGNSDRVTAITTFTQKFNNNNNDFSVDYLVKLPKSISIEVDNKFGDIIINEVDGKCDITLGYGKIQAKRLMNQDNNLVIKFSEGYIGYVESSELELKYSELDIEEAVDMTAETKFSEFKIGSIEVLTLETGYDDDYIGSVRDLDIESGFSDVEVRSLEKRLVADCDYGELTVKQVAKDFTLIDITSSFSDGTIGLYPGVNFKIIATVKMGDLDFPEDKARFSVLDLSGSSKKYEGVVGEGDETNARILVEAKYSDITIYYR
jgi:hypothetical protein